MVFGMGDGGGDGQIRCGFYGEMGGVVVSLLQVDFNSCDYPSWEDQTMQIHS